MPARLLTLLLLLFTGLLPACAGPSRSGTGNVIFVHPDGASAASWAAARAWLVGPDGDLEWDAMPHVGVYRGHMADSLSATSNGGATTHATGVKVDSDAYGRSAGGSRGRALVDAAGQPLSIAEQALRRGHPVGLVQTGTSTEPGTGCFLAAADRRQDHEAIAARLVESGAAVLLGGGERYFLPAGTTGVHGDGVREDGRDLIARAEQLGYTVVRTREALRRLPADTERVLGLFASNHTFNARPEEVLRERGLPRYAPEAPTVAEMCEAALAILSRQDEPFLLVVEEEGTDNFGNNNNARGMLEAMERADAALGVCRAFVARQPDTLLITAADGDAGGMRLVGIPQGAKPGIPDQLPERAPNGAPIDGVDGTGSAPFIAAADRTGRRLPFYIVWAELADVAGGVLVRAEGLGAERVRGSVDNTDVPRLMRLVLFGTETP